jgi:hypothetical protein
LNYPEAPQPGLKQPVQPYHYHAVRGKFKSSSHILAITQIATKLNQPECQVEADEEADAEVEVVGEEASKEIDQEEVQRVWLWGR